MNTALEVSKRSKGMVKITTSHPEGSDFDGIVLGSSKDLVIIQQITSFEPDGIVVIPKAWIEDVRNGPFEKCANEILTGITAVDRLTPPPYANLPHLDQIIDHLHDKDIWPAVEVIYKGRPSVYVGPITSVAVHSFELLCYNAAGKWEKKYELDFEEVFKLEIESKYVTRFNEYMRAKGGRPGTSGPGPRKGSTRAPNSSAPSSPRRRG